MEEGHFGHGLLVRADGISGGLAADALGVGACRHTVRSRAIQRISSGRIQPICATCWSAEVSSLPSRERAQTATASITINSGRKIAMYANKNPFPPQKVLPFQIACRTTAVRNPRIGAERARPGTRRHSDPNAQPCCGREQRVRERAHDAAEEERDTELPRLQRLQVVDDVLNEGESDSDQAPYTMPSSGPYNSDGER